MLTAMVLIDVDAGRIPEVAAEIAEVPGVSEVYSVTGEVDLIAMIRVRQHEELADVIADKVSKVEGVLRTQTYIAFRDLLQARPRAGVRHRPGGLTGGRPPDAPAGSAAPGRDPPDPAEAAVATAARRRVRPGARRASPRQHVRGAPSSTARAATSSAAPSRSRATRSPCHVPSATSAAAALSRTASRTGPRSPSSTRRATSAL